MVVTALLEGMGGARVADVAILTGGVETGLVGFKDPQEL